MTPPGPAPAPATDPAFRLSGVGVAYDGRDALDGVDLEVRTGEVVAVVGPSGAGKTTLLRVLNGAVAPARGSACLAGLDLSRARPAELRAARSRVGFVHQDHALVPNLRAVQNVVAGRLGRRGWVASLRSLLWPSRADLEEVHALLERLGVGERLYARTDTLSGGQMQRIAVARALFQRPAALLADEPVASVDPERARATVALLVDLARERGLTLVVSLHDLALAREFFPRTVGLRAGRVLFDRPTSELGDADFARLYELPAAAALPGAFRG
jgi:phosphonate transport system ATP-binding protein